MLIERAFYELSIRVECRTMLRFSPRTHMIQMPRALWLAYVQEVAASRAYRTFFDKDSRPQFEGFPVRLNNKLEPGTLAVVPR